MNDVRDRDIDIEAYRVARETRNFEISLFWQRSNYFLVLNTAAAFGFFSLRAERYEVLLAVFGMVVSFIWIAVNLGGKFWQSRWEHRLRVVETHLRPELNLFSAPWETVQADVKASFEFRKRGRIHQFYSRLVSLKPSVSMWMTLLSVCFLLFWVVVSLFAISNQVQAGPGATSKPTSGLSDDVVIVKLVPSDGSKLGNFFRSPAGTTILALVTALAGFVVAQWWEREKSRNAATQKYHNLIQATADELAAYLPRLGLLSQQLSALADAVNPTAQSPDSPSILPSFRLYPSFLERAKLELATFMRNPEIVRQVSYCHFELCHVAERLVHLTRAPVPPVSDVPAYRDNILGFKKLVDSTIETFKQTETFLRNAPSSAILKRDNGTGPGYTNTPLL